MDMDDGTVRLALERHWQASDAGDFEAEHEIYRENAILIIRNPASGFAVGATSRKADSCSRTGSASLLFFRAICPAAAITMPDRKRKIVNGG